MAKPMSPLRQRMLEDMQVRNLSPHTQRAYIEQVARFARYFGRSPADLGAEDVRLYQICLHYQIYARYLVAFGHEARELPSPRTDGRAQLPRGAKKLAAK